MLLNLNNNKMNILIIILVAVVTFIAFLLIMTLFIKKEHAWKDIEIVLEF